MHDQSECFITCRHRKCWEYVFDIEISIAWSGQKVRFLDKMSININQNQANFGFLGEIWLVWTGFNRNFRCIDNYWRFFWFFHRNGRVGSNVDWRCTML